MNILISQLKTCVVIYGVEHVDKDMVVRGNPLSPDRGVNVPIQRTQYDARSGVTNNVTRKPLRLSQMVNLFI